MTEALTLDEMLEVLAFHELDDLMGEPGLEPRCTVAAVEGHWAALSALLDENGRDALFGLDEEHNRAALCRADFMLRLGLLLGSRLQASRDGGAPLTAAGIAGALAEAGTAVEREAYGAAVAARVAPLERAMERLQKKLGEHFGEES